VEVGPDVERSDLKPGDRIAGTTHGGNQSQPDEGCFAEYTLAKGDLVVKIPDDLAMEKAATFPLGASTVGQGMFQTALRMDLPGEGKRGNGENVLIYVSTQLEVGESCADFRRAARQQLALWPSSTQS
jgi:NADPH:quinone reductase-like Zn-dependent oxidoreductase